jgi:hypothetical protein
MVESKTWFKGLLRTVKKWDFIEVLMGSYIKSSNVLYYYDTIRMVKTSLKFALRASTTNKN